MQVGYLSAFLSQFEWWNLRPANELLVEQPGEEQYNHFISVMQSLDQSVILAYTPREDAVRLYNAGGTRYDGQWFNPRDNSYQEAVLKMERGQLRAEPPGAGDWVLVLRKG